MLNTAKLKEAFDSKVEPQFQDVFDPKDYLNENFSIPDEEDRFTARFLVDIYKTMPGNFKILEFGGGPSLFSAFTYAKLAREIHFSDYVPASLDDVHLWMSGDDGGFNWRPQIKIILQLEGLPPTESNILKRIKLTRKAITALLHCDARRFPPLNNGNETYDLVAAHHCTDVAAQSNSDWVGILKNVASLVNPGGWLTLSVTTGTQIYTVNGTEFPCVSLTSREISDGYRLAGFYPATLEMREMLIPSTVNREYTGMIIAHSRKAY
jgi:hypothetical protein